MANENETVEQIADEIKNTVSKYGVKAFGPIIYAYTRGNLEDRILAAHKRELAAKDEEIAKRNALIKELADALKKIDDMCDGDACKFFTKNEHCSKCKYVETCQTGIAHNVLITHESEIAKAREVVNVPRGTLKKKNEKS